MDMPGAVIIGSAVDLASGSGASAAAAAEVMLMMGGSEPGPSLLLLGCRLGTGGMDPCTGGMDPCTGGEGTASSGLSSGLSLWA
jgi:hypothetical protein